MNNITDSDFMIHQGDQLFMPENPEGWSTFDWDKVVFVDEQLNEINARIKKNVDSSQSIFMGGNIHA